MIVVILAGGLGNQMFEYAAGKALALRNNTELVLNIRNGFNRDKVYNRVFCLDVFNIKYIQRRLLSFDFPYGFVLEKISRKLGVHILFPWYRYLVEDTVSMNDILEPNKYKNVVLVGGWVKQDYFSDYIDSIRDDFTPSISLPNEVLAYVDNIHKSTKPVVAMGVRIYQEIHNQEMRAKSFFYTSSEFYNKALAYYKEKLGFFKLLIFTQAREWVEHNIDLEGIEYEFVQTSNSDRDAINDMYIMSHCNHYILSNSTFYFWGAWMNKGNKIVIVPDNWKKTPLNEWIKISNQ